MNETKSLKVVLLIVAIIYLISPVDLASGLLIDDFAVLGAALMPFFRRAIN